MGLEEGMNSSECDDVRSGKTSSVCATDRRASCILSFNSSPASISIADDGDVCEFHLPRPVIKPPDLDVVAAKRLEEASWILNLAHVVADSPESCRNLRANLLTDQALHRPSIKPLHLPKPQNSLQRKSSSYQHGNDPNCSSRKLDLGGDLLRCVKRARTRACSVPTMLV